EVKASAALGPVNVSIGAAFSQKATDTSTVVLKTQYGPTAWLRSVPPMLGKADMLLHVTLDAQAVRGLIAVESAGPMTVTLRARKLATFAVSQQTCIERGLLHPYGAPKPSGYHLVSRRVFTDRTEGHKQRRSNEIHAALSFLRVDGAVVFHVTTELIDGVVH